MKPLALGLLLAALALGPAAAHQYSKGDLTVVHPSSRPAAKGMTGVGYFSVSNRGATPDVLLKVESPIAARVEIHESLRTGSVTKMRKVKGGVAVPAKGRVKLETGGTHVMLLKLKRPLAIGDKVPATLVFRNAGRVEVQFLVQKGAGKESHAH